MKDSSKCNFVDYLRKPKVKNISVFDVLSVFGISILIGYLVNNKYPFSTPLWLNIFIIFFIGIFIGIIIHKIFRIPTMLNYYLGLNTLKEVMDKRKIC